MVSHYDSPFPQVLWMAAAFIAAAAQVWFWRRTALTGLPRIIVCACRLAVMAGAAWLLMNPQRLPPAAERPLHAVLLLDASRSMELPGEDGLTREAQASAVRHAVENDSRLAGGIATTWFGTSATSREPAKDDPLRQTTMAGAALRQVLAAHPAGAGPDAIVLVSDGAAQDREAVAAMAKTAAARRIPVAVMPVGISARPAVNSAIAACLVERRAAPGTKLPVTVTVQRTWCQDQPATLTLTERGTGKVIDTAELSTRPGGEELETVELHLTTGAEPLQVVARLSPVEGESTVADNETSFTVESTEPKIRVLYMEGTETINGLGRNEVTMLPDGVKQEDPRIGMDTLTLNVANSSGGSVLMRATWADPGDIRKDERGYPRTKEELFRYDLVICSDIPQVSFTKEQIDWTVELVAERGGGFMMIGGYTSFGTGKWDRTPWEKLIPVDMTYAGRGYSNAQLQPFWTEEGKGHPILRNLPREGETLAQILETHPPLLGTNFINRSKPAAVTLMRQDDESGQPIITVQQYGKGRTMAFSSDITTGWGALHNTMWGPQDGTGMEMGTVTVPASGIPPQPPSNAYYRRFWTSVIHWLTEKSVAQNASRFFGGSPSLTWLEDQPLGVYAIAADPELSAKVSAWRTVAWLKDQPSVRSVLHWQAEGSRFTGSLPRPASLPEGENTIMVETASPDRKERYRSEFTVRVLPHDPELSRPRPQPEVLEELAAITGGPVLRGGSTVTAWLHSLRERRAAQAAATASVPAWDRWPLLAALLGLLGLEWGIRRFYT